MTTEMFAATIRPYNIVGRGRELAQLREGIFNPGRDTRYFIIRGLGGQGKSRLLEEILCSFRHPEVSGWANAWPCPDWRQETEQEVLVLGLIDLIDTRLHASNHFINALYEKFQALGVEFENYLHARRNYEYLVQQGTSYQVAQQAAQEAEQAFWLDYRHVAATKRIVWLIDTAEQLNVVTSHGLLEKEVPGTNGEKLLRPADRHEQTQVWLANQIQNKDLENSTLIFAGRGEEGKPFFDTIETAIRNAGETVCSIRTGPFPSWQIAQQYFQQLAQDWTLRAQEPAEPPHTLRLAENMSALAADTELMKVLWLYTRGQPVLLSLFADLVLEEALAFPSIFNMPYQEAERIMNSSPRGLVSPDRMWHQWQVEAQFITLLFAPGTEETGSLYRDILLCLVRSPRGLSVEQLHYLLDSAGTPPHEWIPDQGRLLELEYVLTTNLGRSTLLKRRQNGYGLQDEIYRIYAEHLAPHIYPTDRTLEILPRLDREEVENKYGLELQARREQYRMLRDWAEHFLTGKRRELADIRLGEERELEWMLAGYHRPDPESIRFPPLSQLEQDKRWQLHNDLVYWQLEFMHYSLLLDFQRGFHDVYRRIADERTSKHDEDRDVLVQAEMRRLLNDTFAMRFVPLEEQEGPGRQGMTTLESLQWTAEQEDVGRWLKRMVFIRQDYDRAIELADNVAAVVAALPETTEEEQNVKEAWDHTLARGERICWREYARIMKGVEIDYAIAALEEIGPQLRRLAAAPPTEMVFDRGRSGEYGFLGHPAEGRLAYIIAMVYNHAGVGYAVQHKFRAAVAHYATANRYARQANDESNQAYILNNLSLAESELGRRGRARRFCLDALHLRRKKGVISAIALSHCTLALIYNHQNQPDDAWRSAAKAVAYARRIKAGRTEGLALRYLGEALRGLANQELHPGRWEFLLPEPPQTYFPLAREALEHALFIFTSGQAAAESPRMIDVRNELGCLHRDWLQILSDDPTQVDWRIHFDQAMDHFQSAAVAAARLKLQLPSLEALVNRAWTFYRAGMFAEAEAEVKSLSLLLEPPLQKGQPLPTYTDREAREYFLLSKIFHLKARIKMEQLKEQWPDIDGEDEDLAVDSQITPSSPELTIAVEAAADAAIHAIVYAQLFSSRSDVSSLVFDFLYETISQFNDGEQEVFAHHATQLWNEYKAGDIETEKFGLIPFLQESFGFPS